MARKTYKPITNLDDLFFLLSEKQADWNNGATTTEDMSVNCAVAQQMTNICKIKVAHNNINNIKTAIPIVQAQYVNNDKAVTNTGLLNDEFNQQSVRLLKEN